MTISPKYQRIALCVILLLALLLRLKGINNPIIDHPGWRQGDEAAIAQNFAFTDPNPLHPQADYNGPGPNYVELELQIVPYIASLAYRVFGVHEIFGRLVSVVASLGTIGVLFCFGRWFFGSAFAGLAAALLYAIAPGAIYYGRTFQPDTTMALFFTWAIFVGARSLLEDEKNEWRGTIAATVLVMLAILAKSVAIILFIPLIAVSISRFGIMGTITRPQNWLILLGSLIPFVLYDNAVRSIASWRWASGITTLHVIPGIKLAFHSPHAFIQKLGIAVDALTMLSHTMLGPVLFALLILGFITPLRNRSSVLMVSWLGAALAYLYIVVTVERVDYYLYPFVPLAALVGGAYIGAAFSAIRWDAASPRMRNFTIASLSLALLVTLLENRREIADYYQYNHHLVHEATVINTLIDPHALVVVAHLDPSTLYYMHHRGWQEDPYLWTPFDEQSAIRKGARYFVVVEPDRFNRNVELSAWMQRFPLLKTPPHVWDVYITDPKLELPGAEKRWKAFRKLEKMSRATTLNGKHGKKLRIEDLQPDPDDNLMSPKPMPLATKTAKHTKQPAKRPTESPSPHAKIIDRDNGTGLGKDTLEPGASKLEHL